MSQVLNEIERISGLLKTYNIMENQNTKTRRYFHETQLPEILLAIGSDLLTGCMTDFSDDELRIYCSLESNLYIGQIVDALYFKQTDENYCLERLRVQRIRKNELTEQLSVSLLLPNTDQIERFQNILKKMTLLTQQNTKGVFELKTFPWFPGSAHYSERAIEKRQEWLEKTTGIHINALNESVFFPPSLSGNIENYIGAVQIPVGIAGPIKINGMYANGYIPIPIATTEGALVSSITRGAMATNMAGGIDVQVVKQQMVRAPAFFCEDIHGAVNLEKWIYEHQMAITKEAEKMSSVAKLIQIIPFLFGDTLHLKFHFRTGDASGQNMTTACTWAACEWIVSKIQEDPYIKYQNYIIDGNLAGDKKVTAQNFLMGRGVTVTGTCFVSGQILRDVLRITADDYIKNFQAGEVAGLKSGMVGHNINFANVIAGIFTATGQDIASVHESSCGILKARKQEDGILFTVYLPSLTIGTIGGGTGLPTQKESLKIMGCYGQRQLFRFAEIIASSCLALDLSTGAAVTAQEFVSAHERLGRNRNHNQLTKSELNIAFFNSLFTSREVVSFEALDFSENEGLVSHLTSKSNEGITGLFKYELTTKTQTPSTLDLSEEKIKAVLKLKASHKEAIRAASMVIKLSGEDVLPGYFETYHAVFGFDNCDEREMAFYTQAPLSIKQFCPQLLGARQEPQRQVFALLLEDVTTYLHSKSSNDASIWNSFRIQTVVSDLAKVHSVYWNNYEAIPQTMKVKPFLERFDSSATILLKEALKFNAQNHPHLISVELHQKLAYFLDNFDRHLDTMNGYHKTLIHNDCNARNIGVREEGEKARLILFDWELAAYHNPQRDLIELLASVLPASASKAEFITWVDYYLQALSRETQTTFDRELFLKVLEINAYECALIRLNLYLLVHNIMKLEYIDQLYGNVIRFGIEA